ncbi:MAG: hypothetical protein O3B01_31005 [Planctomycetota bacterium]|nr:hypothetical protein [Planctomycetota bacterium]MDA1143011.1 hypothetical protein [Planctomycetota bacterium]
MLLESESSTETKSGRRPLWSSRKSLAVFLAYLAAFLTLVVCGGFVVDLNPVERGVLQRVAEKWTVRPAHSERFGFEHPIHIRPAKSANKKRVFHVTWAGTELQVQAGESGDLSPGAEVYVVFQPLKLWQFVRLGFRL